MAFAATWFVNFWPQHIVRACEFNITVAMKYRRFCRIAQPCTRNGACTKRQQQLCIKVARNASMLEYLCTKTKTILAGNLVSSQARFVSMNGTQ